MINKRKLIRLWWGSKWEIQHDLRPDFGIKPGLGWGVASQENRSVRVTWIEIYTFLQEAAVKGYFQIVIKMSLPPTTVSVLWAQCSSERTPRREWREFLPSPGFFLSLLLMWWDGDGEIVRCHPSAWLLCEFGPDAALRLVTHFPVITLHYCSLLS